LNDYAMGASLLGTFVEFVEALTIILAVGSIRGWRNSLFGAVSAIVVLIVLVTIVGEPLAAVIQVGFVQFLVGVGMLLFGIRWLRKAILRYAGLKALHSEADSYAEEVERQKGSGTTKRRGIDKAAFATTFGGTFLEGLEAIFIVITFGLSAHSMKSTIVGAILATLIVIVMGLLLRKPLSLIPENTMKFVVGVMLTSFGTFWVGESLSVDWPQKDLSILYMVAIFCLFSWLVVARCKRALALEKNNSASNHIMGVQ
jgi:Ca2+/H+ antiporter, TMEM165/GDT1 family